ncbi:outer membrane protein [Sulfurovum mangrovi]|uniref:outer membrane protein n=1 Tax=Sulfurovum mangrovi TaxID=2893889 RepID=UPI001E51F320|nr:porin family protein [Sulfurovum mangrovi]UFH58555.1 porin family protein [Sulfurovum mangrovi]
MKKLLLPIALVATNGLLLAGGDLHKAVEPVVNIPTVTEEVSENNFYVGVGLAAVSVRDSDVSANIFEAKAGQDRLGNIDLIAGYEFHRHFAVEGRYTTTIAESDSIDTMDSWSIFAKPKYPVTENIELYGLLGYGNVQVEGTDEYMADIDESGFQWGLGLSYMINENLDFFVDYKFLANDIDVLVYKDVVEMSVDSLTAGLIYKF